MALRKRTDPSALAPRYFAVDTVEALTPRTSPNCVNANCSPRAAVAIELSLQPPSPENGNIRDVGWRLSAIPSLEPPNSKPGDLPPIRKSPL
jgi:hypothetical protein